MKEQKLKQAKGQMDILDYNLSQLNLIDSTAIFHVKEELEKLSEKALTNLSRILSDVNLVLEKTKGK
jgi:hypothetical protein